MPKKSTNAKILMIALASMHYEDITRLSKAIDSSGYINPREREKEILKQRRRQQYKK